jgi:hypothetical protein
MSHLCLCLQGHDEINLPLLVVLFCSEINVSMNAVMTFTYYAIPLNKKQNPLNAERIDKFLEPMLPYVVSRCLSKKSCRTDRAVG